MKKVLLLALAVCQTMLFNLNAQTNTVVTVPPLAGGNGAGGVTFNLSVSSAPVIVDTILCAFYGAGVVELWYSPVPINGAPTVTPANGWVLLGTANIVNLSTGTTNPILQPIPIPVNLFMNPGQTYGFAVSGPSTVYTTYSGGQSFFTDGTVGIETGTNVGYGGNVPNPANHPRQFNGGVRYRIAQNGFNNAATMAINPTLVCPGPQQITATIGNFGTNQISALTLNWEVNGSAQPPIPVSQLLDTITGNGSYSAQINLGILNFIAGQSTTVKVWTSSPNGGLDTINSNDTLVRTWIPSLTGTFTVNNTLPTAGNNFNNFNDLASALSTYGVCGPVDVNVMAGGTFTEQVTFNAIPGSSQTNRINIFGNNSIIDFNANTTNRFVVRFNGASFVTMQDLTIRSLNATFGWGVVFGGSASNDTLRNCTVDISSVSSTTSTNSVGIAVTGTLTSPLSTGNNCSDCAIIGNTIIGRTTTGGPYYGIAAAGTTGGGSANLLIEGNDVRDAYFYSIYTTSIAGLKIYDNLCHRPTKTATTTFYGIYNTGAVGGVRIERNRIFKPEGTSNMTSIAYGIYLLGDATAGNESVVANNVIYDFKTNGTQYGIYLSSPEFHKIMHNTISLDATTTTSSSATYGFYVSGSMIGTDVANNVVSITRSSTGITYGLYFATSGAFVNFHNNNNLYIQSNGTNYYGYYNSAQYASRAAFAAATGNQYETLSNTYNPVFTNPSTGDFQPQSPGMNNTGVNTGGVVPFDILGANRGALPDPGAWEFAGAPNEAAVPQFINPTSNYCPGNDSIFVRLLNNGSNTLTSVDLSWSVNGVSQGTLNLSGMNLPSGADSAVFLGIYPLTGTGLLTFQAYSFNPNGVADPFPTNDTITSSLYGGLSGVYTLDGTQPTAGTNFNTWADMQQVLLQGGLCGPVDLFVNPNDTLTEQLNFNLYPGISASNYLYIHGQGGVLTFAPNVLAPHLVKFEGAQYVTLDSLTLIGTDPTYGFGVLFTGDNRFDTVRYVTADLSAIVGTSSTTSTGLLFSGSPTSTSTSGIIARYCAVENSVFKGGITGGPYYGMRMNGLAGGLGNVGNRIANNRFVDHYLYEAFISNADSLVFEHNEMGREFRTNFSTFYGIYTTGSLLNSRINANRIYQPAGNLGGATNTAYGIYLLADGTLGNESVISNNLIHSFNSHSTQYGFYVSSALYNRILHNTVVLDDATSPSGTTYGVFATGTGTGSDFLNNIVQVSRTGTGTKYGFYNSSVTSLDSSDYNDILVNATDGIPYFGYFGTITPTLQDFVNASGRDQNSVSTDPLFLDAANGNFKPTALAIENIGTDVLAAVPADFNGISRTNTPDPGAIEFTIFNDDAGVNAMVNPSTFFCVGNQTVEAQVRNNGLNNLSSVDVNWSVNGQVQAPVSLSGINLQIGGTTQVTLGNFNFVAGQSYQIESWTSLPNGVADQNTTNDSISASVFEGLSGNFTIDPALPSGGTNFTSFSEAADTLEARGICSAVLVEAVSGLYNEQVDMTAIPGASAINTVTYRSQANDSSAVEINFTATSAVSNYTLRLNGAAYVSLEALKISESGTTWGRVIDIRNRAKYNTIKRCYLVGDTIGGSTSNLVANLVSDIGSGGDNYNTISNNRIEGGSYGIFYKGATGNGGGELGSRFIKNHLTRQFVMAMEIDYQDSLLVEGNRIDGNSNFTGVSMGIRTNYAGPGMRIASNIIEAKGSWPNYGIYLFQGAGSNNIPSRVYNNAVMVGDSAVATAVYAIVVDDMVNIDLDHNTCIVREGDQFSGGLFINAGSNIRSRNNNLACRINGIPYICNNSLFVSVSNYNNLNTPGPFIGAMGNLGYGTFGAWKNATGLDLNSVAVNPQFGAWNDYHTCNLSLDGNGTPLGYTHDVDGEIRNMSTPDIGADEFFNATTFSLGPDLYKCANDSVVLGQSSVGPGTYFWSTFENTPTIVVSQAGIYELFLVGSCNSGVDTLEVFDFALPTASFTYTNSYLTYLFTNGASGTGISYAWNFGDGNSSNDANPIHLYTQSGNYTVTLTVTDTCGNVKTSSQTINVVNVGLDALQAGFQLYPNPTLSDLFLQMPESIDQATLEISDLSGRTLQVHTVQQNGQAVPISLSGLSAGTYMLSIHHEQKTWTTRVVKQ